MYIICIYNHLGIVKIPHQYHLSFDGDDWVIVKNALLQSHINSLVPILQPRRVTLATQRKLVHNPSNVTSLMYLHVSTRSSTINGHLL